MSEFLDACVALVNLPYTALLILVVVYWLTVIIGLIDMETIDIDVHHDVDVDLHADVDVHVGAEAVTDAGFTHDVHKDIAVGPGVFHSVLQFFNVGEVPLMVLISVFSFCMWFISMWTTHTLGITSLWIAIPLFIPISIVSAFIAKYTTAPFRSLYRTLEEDAFEEVSIVGRLCKVKTGTVDEKFGQAEVIREQEGVPLLINVRTRNGEVLQKDEDGVVLEYLDEEDSYVITSLETE